MSLADTSSIHSEAIIDLFRELALDLSAVWNHFSDDIWCQIESDLWLTTRNPWLMLQQTSETRSS
jgi:hypothetical protein